MAPAVFICWKTYYIYGSYLEECLRNLAKNKVFPSVKRLQKSLRLFSTKIFGCHISDYFLKIPESNFMNCDPDYRYNFVGVNLFVIKILFLETF